MTPDSDSSEDERKKPSPTKPSFMRSKSLHFPKGHKHSHGDGDRKDEKKSSKHSSKPVPMRSLSALFEPDVVVKGSVKNKK